MKKRFKRVLFAGFACILFIISVYSLVLTSFAIMLKTILPVFAFIGLLLYVVR